MSLSAKIIWGDVFSALCDSLLIKQRVYVAKRFTEFNGSVHPLFLKV